MEITLLKNEIAAAFFPRVFLGLLFFFQGFDKVFNYKIKGVLDVFERPLTEKGIPKFLGNAGAWFTSYAELAGGTLLIFGLAKYFALYLLGIDLLIVSAAFGIMKPMWDMQFVFPRLALLIFLLVIPSQWDVISIDYLLSKTS